MVSLRVIQGMTIIDPLATHRIAQLRADASRARRAANDLRAAPALELYRRSLPETWQGPAASRCFDDLQLSRRRLIQACDALTELAGRLDRQADQAELAVISAR